MAQILTKPTIERYNPYKFYKDIICKNKSTKTKDTIIWTPMVKNRLKKEN